HANGSGNGNVARDADAPDGRESYYYAQGQRIPVNKREDLVAIRFNPRATAESVSRSGVARATGLEPTEEFKQMEDSTLRFFRVGGSRSARSIREVAESMEAQPEVDKVGEVFTNAYNQPLVLTDELVCKFKPELTADQIERVKESFGLETVEPLGFVENGFVLRVKPGTGMSALEVSNTLVEQGHAVYASPSFIEHIPVREVVAVGGVTTGQLIEPQAGVGPADERELRHVVNDPRFPNQWHLTNTGQGGGTVGADVKAHPAWHVTLGSPDVRIAIIDNEVDIRHEDLNTPGKIVSPIDLDVTPPDNDPSPTFGLHGTSCAGVAAAAQNNGLGGTGVAPGCRLIPIKASSDQTSTQVRLARAFQYAADQQASIISCSLGPDGVPWIMQDVLREAFDYATTYGRGGRGCVIFWAAGNGNESISTDQIASYERIIAVGASNWRDRRSRYSDFGPELDIMAPSNDVDPVTGAVVDGALGINTTRGTVPGPGVPNPTNAYTTGFGGTSSASPLAAGVGALVASVNRNLSWQEVRQVLLDSADKIDSAANPYTPAPAGFPPGTRNNRYGYGRVNAQRAVALAPAAGTRDLYIRDTAGDTGTVPQPNWGFWDSPDIWVRNNDDNQTAHQNTVRGRDNFIHARVRNRGSQPSHPCWVRFYITTFANTQFRYPFDYKPNTSSSPGGTPGNLRPASSFPTPATYFVGMQRVASVPAGGSVVAKVRWPRTLIPPAANWHPCLLVEVSPHDGPAPAGPYVWENNNLAQKNISIVDAARGQLLELPFRFAHDSLKDALTTLEVRKIRAPQNLGLFLDMKEPKLLQAIAKAANVSLPGTGIGGGIGGGVVLPNFNTLPTLTTLPNLGTLTTLNIGNLPSAGIALPWRLTFLEEARVALNASGGRDEETPLILTFPQGSSLELGRGSASAQQPAAPSGEAVAVDFPVEADAGGGARAERNNFSVTTLQNVNVLALNPSLSAASVKVPLEQAGSKESSLKLRVPENARPGDSYVFDVAERDSKGQLVGGIRLQVNVK
ncbi:MAG TPA: S8 family serine peptidase, partial [Pyrinomonadaceae bacterium]|nr:S8 family serine peptidase [Pyrinomonadaceae bacterium]